MISVYILSNLLHLFLPDKIRLNDVDKISSSVWLFETEQGRPYGWVTQHRSLIRFALQGTGFLDLVIPHACFTSVHERYSSFGCLLRIWNWLVIWRRFNCIPQRYLLLYMEQTCNNMLAFSCSSFARTFQCPFRNVLLQLQEHFMWSQSRMRGLSHVTSDFRIYCILLAVPDADYMICGIYSITFFDRPHRFAHIIQNIHYGYFKLDIRGALFQIWKYNS